MRSLRAIGSSTGQPQGRAFAPLGSRLRSWPPVSWAVRDCCDIVRAGWIADKRSCPGGQETRSGLRARRACLWQGQFSGRRIFGNSGRLLIILADNYNQTTNDPTTETQSAQRTHRDFLKGIPGSLQLDGPCGPRAGLARLSLVAAVGPSCVARRGGPACLAGTVGRSGLRVRWRWRQAKAAFPGGWILGKQSLRFSIIIC